MPLKPKPYNWERTEQSVGDSERRRRYYTGGVIYGLVMLKLMTNFGKLKGF